MAVVELDRQTAKFSSYTVFNFIAANDYDIQLDYIFMAHIHNIL